MEQGKVVEKARGAGSVRGGRAGGRGRGRPRGARGGGVVPPQVASPNHGASSQSEARDYSTAEEERVEEARNNRKRKRSERKEEQEKGIPGWVPMNIVDLLLPIAILEKLSERTFAILLTAFLLVCRVDPNKVGLSRWVIHRKKNRFLQNIGGEVLEECASDIKRQNTPLVLHWDSKIVCQDFEGRKELLHRLVTYISSPWLDRGQLLTASPMVEETGAGVAMELHTLVEGLGISSNLVAVCTDTPSVNTGGENGAIIEFFRVLGHPLLKIPCGHHVLELVAKAVMKAVSGRPSQGPEDKVLAFVYNNQNDILDAIPTTNYNFEKFCWVEQYGTAQVPAPAHPATAHLAPAHCTCTATCTCRWRRPRRLSSGGGWP